MNKQETMTLILGHFEAIHELTAAYRTEKYKDTEWPTKERGPLSDEFYHKFWEAEEEFRKSFITLELLPPENAIGGLTKEEGTKILERLKESREREMSLEDIAEIYGVTPDEEPYEGGRVRISERNFAWVREDQRMGCPCGGMTIKGLKMCFLCASEYLEIISREDYDGYLHGTSVEDADRVLCAFRKIEEDWAPRTWKKGEQDTFKHRRLL